MNEPAALHIQGLRKRYRDGTEALKGIDLDVQRGDFFALLGPNGAGKSTAIGIVSSLVNKSAGTVQVFGYDVDTDHDTAKACIGVVPQEFNFNVYENVENILLNQAGYYGLPRELALERAQRYLKKLELWDKRATRSRDLSGGMKRRVMIARALIHEPPLLILDEPTAGVDIEIRRTMWDFLRDINAAGTTIILTTHYLEEAESLCNNVAIINHGQIVERNNMKDLLARLHMECFVLTLRRPLAAAPEIPGHVMELIDPTELEVNVPQSQGLNELFQALSAMNIEVTSMRNKSNRLEQLFLHLVDQSREGAAAAEPHGRRDTAKRGADA